MRHPLRWTALVFLSGMLLAVGVAPSASGVVPAITKSDFITKADKICAADGAKLTAAVAKLGTKPTDKQIQAYLVGVYVPNIAGQIAKIRKLGFPTADKAQLMALFKEADQVLAKIKKNPAAVAASNTNPFSDVIAKQQAYGFTSCGASSGSSSGGAAVLAFAQSLAGHYQGPWNNTTFGSTGTVDLTISVDATAKTLKTVTTLTGNVFGAAPPPTETLTVPLPTDSTTPVTVTSPTFGAMTFTYLPDGSLVEDAPNVPSANAATFHLVLKPSATGIDGTYTVKLKSGTTANGTLTLKKV